MIVRYGDAAINLNLTKIFKKEIYFVETGEVRSTEDSIYSIDFEPDSSGCLLKFEFDSREERDKAFDIILEDLRWKKDVCDLDESMREDEQ